MDQEFNQQCIDAHNECRSLHGCPPFSLSQELAKSSQKWAEFLASKRTLKHSTNDGTYGENIAMKMLQGSTEYTGKQATAQWYSEIEFYDFNGPENQMRCGHFSQVVWKETTEAGFGKAIASDGKMFSVGQYRPPGNFTNEWKKNIPAPLSGQIYVPTKEEIMGKQNVPSKVQTKKKAPAPNVDSSKSNEKQPFSSMNSEILKNPNKADTDFESPSPRSPEDQIIKTSKKKKTANGETTVIVEATYQRPNGSKYLVVKETKSGGKSQIQDSMKDPIHNFDFGFEEPVLQATKKKKIYAAPPGSNNLELQNVENARTFSEAVLKTHNELRNLHNVPTLSRSDSLTNLAQTFAETLAKEDQLRCQSLPEYAYHGSLIGQNISRNSSYNKNSDAVTASEELVYQWYSEYDGFFANNSNLLLAQDLNGGHFTQLIWKESEMLGVGIALNSNNVSYVVCFYYPAGNIKNEFDLNVEKIN